MRWKRMMSRSWDDTLRDLRAAQALLSALYLTAPVAVAAAGGAAALVAKCGRPTGARFWGLRPMPEGLWEAMAREHAERARGMLD